MKQLIGTGVALVTPFNEDKSIDYEGLAKLVNYQIENGINYLVALGTTGEPATLTEEEKEKVKETIIKTNNGRLPLVLGLGGNNTAEVVQQLQTTDLTNFDAVLSVSPYYNKPTQSGIYEHFKAVALASNKPIIIYNVPGRTAKNIEPKTVIKLATDFKNIVAVKEAAGDMVQALRLLQNKPKDFLVISGDDMIALPMTLAGASGVISVIGQGLPKKFATMIQLGIQGKGKDAYDIMYEVMDSIDYIFEESNPAGIKSVLKQLSICGDEVRLPLVKATDNLNLKIKEFLQKCN